jgi:hypothetical protein
MEPKSITLDGVEFRLNPLRPRSILRITKNLVQLIGAGTREGTKIQIMTAVADGLQSMGDDEFEDFCLLMLATTQAVTKSGPVEITTPDAFDKAFTGVGIENVFVLLYEVLVYNRFPLVRNLDLNIGELIQGIELTLQDEMSPKNNEKNTEVPENSPKS